jgi:membrane protease YdiL (CAAX protease family)
VRCHSDQDRRRENVVNESIPAVTIGSGGRRTVHWLSVLTFYAIACGISWPYFWWRDLHNASWSAWGAPDYIKGLVPAIGPALGAVVTLWLFRRQHPRTISLLGTSAGRSVAFVLTPLVALTVAASVTGYDPVEAALTAILFVVYAFGEELGWRGFLQDALRPLPPVPRYLLIGALWGAWHLTTFTGGGWGAALPRLAAMSTLWVLGSWGLGRATDATRAVAVAAMLHLIFNFGRHLPGTYVWWALGISAIAWFVLLRSWPAGGANGPATPASR